MLGVPGWECRVPFAAPANKSLCIWAMAGRPTNTLPLPDAQSASSVKVAFAASASPRVHAAPCVSRTDWIAALSADSEDWAVLESHKLNGIAATSATTIRLNMSTPRSQLEARAFEKERHFP